MLRKRLSARVLGVLSLLLVSSPIWIYLVDAPSFGRLQHNDYYAVVGALADGDSLTRDPLRWLAHRTNEHRLTVPALVYALNIALTRGNNLGLTAFSLLLLTVQLALLVRMLPDDLRSLLWARTLFGLGLAFFCYTPVAAHNVAMGFSGTIWFSANVLAVAAIGALTRRAQRRGAWNLWPVLLFGVLAAFSYSTYLALWPALLAGAVFLRLGFRQLALLAAGAAAVFALFALTYEPLPYHPEMETRDFAGLLRYAAAYLGSLFSPDVAGAKTLGMAAIAAAVVIAGLVLFLTRSSRSLRSDLGPWLMIMLYGLGNALLAAVGRSGFGETQAMSSRYASLAALFWIGLLTSLGILAWRHRPRPLAGRAVVAVALALTLAVLAAAMYRRGAPLIDRFVARGHRQEVAALAIVHDIRDDEIIEKTVAPWPTHVWGIRDFLRALGHVPFDRERPLRLGERIPGDRLSRRSHPRLGGHFDQLVPLGEGLFRLRGWAFSSEAAIGEVLVLDGEGTVRGELVRGIIRPDLVPAFSRDALEAGWEGYALLGADGGLGVYVRLAGDPLLYPLPAAADVGRLLSGG